VNRVIIRSVPQKLKRRFQELMSKDLSEQLSYNKENIKLKVTYEVECNYESALVLISAHLKCFI